MTYQFAMPLERMTASGVSWAENPQITEISEDELPATELSLLRKPQAR